MLDPNYFSGLKAWLSPEELTEVAPGPPTTDTISPRLCRGCGEPLPDKRKAFHSKACQGAWLSRRSPTVIKAAKAKEANA